ncbi:MAG: dTMP kinase [Candidatus Pacearchaeota archaeon]
MFIVFEGIDGCGKSTQIVKFTEFIFNKDKGNHIILTREPYKSKEIREILKINEDPKEKSEKLTELFIEDRRKHIEEIINPALNKNLIVICDRYKYSTICYQAAQGIEIEKLVRLHKYMPVPDVIFIFDLPVDIAFERIKNDKNRKDEYKFEKNKEFLDKVRKNYLKMKKIFQNENIVIINSNKTIEEIFEEIKSYFTI